MSAKRKKRMKFRPKKLIKRLIMLTLLGFVLGGLFVAGRSAYRAAASMLTAERGLQTALVEQVADQSGISAEAAVLRLETVILAVKPGEANPLVAEGAIIKPGQKVLELVDRTLMASIDEQLAKLKPQDSKPDETGQTRLAQAEEKLAQAEAELQKLMSDYRVALRNRDAARYRTVSTSIDGAAKEVSKLQQDRLLIQQSQVSIEEQRARLEAQRAEAAVLVYSPSAGAVSFQVDGYEQYANIAHLKASLFNDLKQLKTENYSVAAGAAVKAGSPAFKVATSPETHLLVNLPAGSLATISGWAKLFVQVSTAGVALDLPATIQSHPGLGADQCLLKVTMQPGVVLPRFPKVTLHTEGLVLSRIPKTAQSGEQVFVLQGNVVKATPVVVRQTEKKSLVVTGLNPGDTIVLNPSGLTDGMDVSSRLRK